MYIRRADLVDEQMLAQIRRSAILDLAVPVMSMEQAQTWALHVAPDRIARAIQDHEVWVAVEAGPIGWIEIDRNRIAALYVAPYCARRGVGSALLTLAETIIRRSGYLTVQLDSSPNALAFYLRRGYLQSSPLNADGGCPVQKQQIFS